MDKVFVLVVLVDGIIKNPFLNTLINYYKNTLLKLCIKKINKKDNIYLFGFHVVINKYVKILLKFILNTCYLKINNYFYIVESS